MSVSVCRIDHVRDVFKTDERTSPSSFRNGRARGSEQGLPGGGRRAQGGAEPSQRPLPSCRRVRVSRLQRFRAAPSLAGCWTAALRSRLRWRYASVRWALFLNSSLRASLWVHTSGGTLCFRCLLSSPERRTETYSITLTVCPGVWSQRQTPPVTVHVLVLTDSR